MRNYLHQRGQAMNNLKESYGQNDTFNINVYDNDTVKLHRKYDKKNDDGKEILPDNGYRFHEDFRIALFVATLNPGGAEKMMVNLANGFAAQGYKVDLILGTAIGPYLRQLDGKVRLVDLQSQRIMASIRKLRIYLHENNPDVLISTQVHVNIAALAAVKLSHVKTTLIFREASTFSIHSKREKTLKGRAVAMASKLFYRFADAYIAVSGGVAEDLHKTFHIPERKISVIYNPVVNDQLYAKSNEENDHPWFAKDSPRVILACGRLTKSKDYPTLLRAFSLVRKKADVRLMILGDDPDAEGIKEQLLLQASELGISEHICLPGFMENPYSFMRRSSVFVLSSLYEGLPGVLIQAMACGCPVVSTDCPSGPREILDGGRFGALVETGNAEQMAGAILNALENRQDKSSLIQRANKFSVENSINDHLNLFKSFVPDRLLLLGPMANRFNVKKTGGAIVLFSELLNNIGLYTDNYEVIDTNKKNYRSVLSAYMHIISEVISKARKCRHIALHSSSDYIIIAPLLILIARILNAEVSLRKFGGNMGCDMERKYLGVLVRWIVRRVNYLFVETKASQSIALMQNSSTYWFPNSRTRKIATYRHREFDRRFVFISHIIKEKGINEIIDAARGLDDSYTIDLYGPVPKSDIDIAALNSGIVRYRGELSFEDVAPTLSRYDVLLLPSYKEGYPGIVIEAYSLGIPVITTRLESIMEICADGVQGRLVEPRNSAQLLEAIQWFDQENYDRLSKEAFRSFENFDSTVITNDYLNIISGNARTEKKIRTKKRFGRLSRRQQPVTANRREYE